MSAALAAEETTTIVSNLLNHQILVPGSIANLGPGFDCLGVAVQLYLRLRVSGTDESRSGLEFHFTGKPPEGENYIERAFRYMAQNHLPKPGLSVEVTSDIPMKGGLGSSAAATVAGLRLFEAVYGRRAPQELLAAATLLEGHPDNAAPALFGGLTICCQRRDGGVTATSVRWPEHWSFLVLTPELTLETKKARAALPESVPLRDAVANLQRVATIVAAVQNADEAALADAFHDRLHQPFRQALVPGLAEVLELRHPTILGAFLSGSGPSIAVLVKGDPTEAEQLLRAAYQPLHIPFQIRRLEVHSGSSAARQSVS
jgi:homoserine kinase